MPIEGLPRRFHQPAFAPVLPHSVNHVVARHPFADQRGNHLGRILQITVHQNDSVADAPLHAAGKGHLRSEVPAVRDHREARVLGCQFRQQFLRIIGAIVVDVNDLVARRHRPQDFREPAVHLAHAAGVAIASHHHGNHLPG